MKLLALALSLVGLATSHELLDQAEIIAQVQATDAKWVAGHNHKFDGMSLEEVKTLMGTILETPEELKLPERHMEPRGDIPTEFDSRTAWPNCESIKEIRDQSTCGSCWAFGAAEAMSDRLCISSGQKDQTRISSEDLLTCCGFSCGNGCNGGYPSGAWNYFKRSGLVTGDLYGDKKYCMSYSFPPCDHHTPDGKYGPCGSSKPTPSCKKTCNGDASRSYTSDKWHADTAYSVPSNVEKLQTEIMTRGPIEVAFTVYSDFLTYKEGVY